MRNHPPESNDGGKYRTRARVERATLELSGERGLAALSVQAIIERCGISRSRFYTLFESREDCYARAHSAGVERLTEELLIPGRAARDWLAGLRAALDALDRFLIAEPALARGVLAEAYVAGGAAMAKRQQVVDRLCRAVDRARRDLHTSRQPPPPTTAAFIVSAIEAVAIRSLTVEGNPDFGSTVPELLYLAVSFYFDPVKARKAYVDSLRDG